MGVECAMGILTLQHREPCLRFTTNQILCSLETVSGFIIVILLLREIRRVFALLQAIIVLHSLQTCCLIGVCLVSLAEADPTIEAKYTLYSLAHVFYAYAISGRLYVLARVVYMSASPQKVRARAQNTWKLAAFLFGMATVQSIINVSLWMFTPLYATPGSNEYEKYHEIGFLVFGVYITCIAIGLAVVTSYVIKLYNGLQVDSDSNEAKARAKAVAILRKMTISVVASQLLGGILSLVLGATPGALRNEVVHIVFFLSQFALVNLIPFVRKTAEIRAAHLAQQQEMSRKATMTTASRSPTTRPSRLSQAEPRMNKSGSSLTPSQAEPEPADKPVTPTLDTRDASSLNASVAPEPSPSSSPIGLLDRLRTISLRSRQSNAQIEQLQQAEEAVQMEVIVESPTATQPLGEEEKEEQAAPA